MFQAQCQASSRTPLILASRGRRCCDYAHFTEELVRVQGAFSILPMSSCYPGSLAPRHRLSPAPLSLAGICQTQNPDRAERTSVSAVFQGKQGRSFVLQQTPPNVRNSWFWKIEQWTFYSIKEWILKQTNKNLSSIYLKGVSILSLDKASISPEKERQAFTPYRGWGSRSSAADTRVWDLGWQQPLYGLRNPYSDKQATPPPRPALSSHLQRLFSTERPQHSKELKFSGLGWQRWERSSGQRQAENLPRGKFLTQRS